MPRTGSCWPLVLWLHYTGRCRNSWHRKFSTSSSEAVRRPCNRPGCNAFSRHILYRKPSRFGLPVLLLFWISRSCLGAKNMPYCFQEHRHPNSLVTHTGSTWWRVLQTKAEDHYYMPVLSSRVRLKGTVLWSTSCKTNIILFWFSASMTEIPPKVSWFW